ncbi:ABC transporter ATP-binding protein [Priestia megaterium]|uniref:ABC transporter ATP-binding protein n=1 Tax=Priestia megaterium TaxID=1404 RepID=UPI002E1A5381|nr:ABC transporter ATP-binding protein [Priestia megaterium]
MKHIFYFIKKLNTFVGKMLYLNLIGMVLVSLLEGIGIFLLIPMLNSSGVVNIGTGSISTVLESFPFHLNLLVILTIYVFLIVAQALLQRSVTIRNAKIQIGFINSLRLDLYHSLLQANWSFFIKKRKSDLINALTNEIGRVSMGTNLTLQLSTSFIFTGIQIALALWLSVKMTLFIVICGGLLAFLSRKFVKKAKTLGNRTSEISKSYLGGITDHFNGMKDVKSNNLEQSQYKWLENWSKEVEHEQLQYIKLKMNSQLYYKVSLGVFLAAFIFLSIKLLDAQPGQLLLVILIFSRLWPRFTNIQSNLEQIASTIPAFKKLIHLQEECEEYKEMNGQNSNDAKPLGVHKEIECKGVFFRYNRSVPEYTLQDVNLKIPANSMTAIIGPSGAGKSTLIDLLMGLLQPEKGQIIIDGIPLTNDTLLSFRRSISYVPQDPFLFNGSIRDNLKMVVPNATEEDIWEALEFSSAAEFVKKLPQELETLVGDRGSRLSGGERQRLVLARAILKKPSILVLDEATSALDSKNQGEVQKALNRIKGRMIILIVTHSSLNALHTDHVLDLRKENAFLYI